MTQETGNQNKDVLTEFKDQYINSDKFNKIQVPFNEPLMFVEDITGLVIYRKGQFQVQLFICVPNCFIPRHRHPNVDSFELFLYGMKFDHSDQTVIDNDMAMEQHQGMPKHQYKTIRVKPNEWHGAIASKNGGAFISIQHWLNGVKPTHVGADWQGETMGQKHTEETMK